MARVALSILALFTLLGCAQPAERGAGGAAAPGRANLINNGDFERSEAGEMYARHGATNRRLDGP